MFFYWQLEMKPFLHNLITHLYPFLPTVLAEKKGISCTVMPPWKCKTRKKFNNMNNSYFVIEQYKHRLGYCFYL